MDKKEEISPALRQLIVKTNLLWLFPDIEETLLMDLDESARRQGRALRFHAKMSYNRAIRSVRALKTDIAACSRGTQETYGADSDRVLAILLAICDRCADDEALLRQVYEHIKELPSKLGLDLSRCDEAFDE